MENLSAPVSESSAVGEYLKGNRAVYRALRNTFNQAQSAYRQLMESPEAMVDNQLQNLNGDCWQALADQCQETLLNTSKDVEILAG
ncbi:type VI secretion system ImpA family N-terminal domain-containing protein [Aliamphritea spongicola]|nr:type VI secretion system ImpA family N-terminal domain-containing protein [Aliamphritea spongicola]